MLQSRGSLNWQAELVPGVWLQGPGIPELGSDHGFGGWGVFPYTVGGGFLGVLKVALACKWAQPAPG